MEAGLGDPHLPRNLDLLRHNLLRQVSLLSLGERGVGANELSTGAAVTNTLCVPMVPVDPPNAECPPADLSLLRGSDSMLGRRFS
jgi:hypothetical protein